MTTMKTPTPHKVWLALQLLWIAYRERKHRRIDRVIPPLDREVADHVMERAQLQDRKRALYQALGWQICN